MFITVASGGMIATMVLLLLGDMCVCSVCGSPISIR